MFATTRRTLIAATASLLVLPLASIHAAAQDWPSGHVTIIVPFPPGGSVDTVVRLIQPHLQERLGANIVVDNRGGASGSIGAAAAANAAPDGNTWLFVFDTQAVNPALIPDLPFDSREDLDPVMLIGTAPNLLATHPDRPFETFEDVLDAAREAPGRINYGSIGSGSLGHLTMILLEEEAGVELTHAPYSGGGPVINDAVAGHIDLVIGSAALVTPQVTAGSLRPLLQTGPERHPALEDVPTAQEAGFEDFESQAWWGVFAPAGVPDEIIEEMHAALTEVFQIEQVADQLSQAQTMQLVLSSPEEFREFFETQMDTWGAVVDEHDVISDS
jgi:tripartite-type tricarboxylate transporter receptor subunit TctC